MSTGGIVRDVEDIGASGIEGVDHADRLGIARCASSKRVFFPLLFSITHKYGKWACSATLRRAYSFTLCPKMRQDLHEILAEEVSVFLQPG